jgi:hypothetical protein
MSLHKFAEQVAANGRGDDSLLVHMTPDEVRNLQKFAEANGTTLTINPETGLPEAGLLSDLFKAVAPLALGAFLGPGAFGIAGMGLSAGMAGAVAGGITTLATGSLSRGLMAGLGAYGGAGLAEGFANAGANAMTTAGVGDYASSLAERGLTAGTAEYGEAASKLALDAQKQAFAAPMTDRLSAGFNAAKADPLAFAKSNLGSIGMAAAPIMAIQPTTQMPSTAKSDNYIRQFDYNINPDTGKPDPLYGMRAMTPVKASEFGNKTFQGQRELFRQQNPNPYDIGIGSLNQPPQQQPTPMAGGGIVALAKGGIPGFVDGGYVPGQFTQAQINAALAAELGSETGKGASMEGLRNVARDTYKLTDAEINAAFDTIPGFNAQGKWDANDYMANSTPGKVDYQLQVDAAAAANPYSAQNMAKVDTTRPGQYVQDPATGQYVALTNYSPGFDINNQETLLRLGELSASPTKNSAGDWFQQNATAEQKAKAADLWNKEKARLTALDVAAGRIPTDNKGLGDLNNNLINQDQNKNLNAGLTALDDGRSRTYKWFEDRKLGFKPIDISIENWFNEYTDDLALLRADKQVDAMKDALNVSGMDEADLVEATGKTIAQWIQQKKEERKDGTKIIAGDLKDVPADSLPGGVSGGGNTFVNANGTITTKPDYSLTMNEVRNAYTDGGGSLGYTSPVVKTPAEHEAAYNKLTDDSLDAYNFLMGKGKNLSQRTASADRPVMRRYDEGVLGRKIGRPTRTTDTTKTTVKGVPGKPQSYFDEKAYLAAHPDVEAELKTGKSISGQPVQFTSGYEHWLRYGQPAGWAFSGDYDGYKTAAAVAANEASVTQQGGDGVSGPGPGPGPSDGGIGTGPGTAKEGGLMGYSVGGGLGSLGSYSDGGRLLRGPGDGVSDSIPATIGNKQQPARLADGEFVIPARIVSELGNGSTEAGAKKLYAMMDRVQRARGKTTGKNKVAANSRADKYLPA